MPFKRKARILFLDSGSGLAADAMAYADSAWLEARAASLPFDSVLIEWADTLITLDERARQHGLLLPCRITQRHYPAKDMPLKEWVESMAGGLRMLARVE